MNENRGSLLVDWSTTLSLVATAATFAVPGLKTFIHESHRSAVVNEIQLQVRRAEAAANQLGQTVTLCAASADGARCAGDGNWSRGWLAFVDVDSDGAMGAHERPLQLWRTQNSHAWITVAAEPATLSFRPYYAQPFARASTGQITVCDQSGRAEGRRIGVDRAGLPHLSPAPGCAS